ncbi:pseudaminic acid synthase [Oscillospiraceae bacterium MB08-C2-2]|nr:pseudaminic acid synthase [Oscillospiraceae bacterium MB08-C2-2]
MFEKLTQGVYTIAEMSANHAGKLENALEIVRAAKEAGADCLKIQTYTADTLTLDCDNEYFRIEGGLWDGYTLHDLYKEAYTPWEWHGPIQAECRKVGLDFLSTPFDATAVDFLEELGVEFYKIASFELVDIPLIEYTASKGKPMVISCGLGSPEDIGEALVACRRMGNEQVILLKCCSEYPANWADMNLAVIPEMQARFGVPIGLSDHSMGSLAAVVAVSMGACVVEKHFCLSRAIKNPDSAFSMEPEEFCQLVRYTQAARQIRGQGGYRLTPSETSSLAFRKSIFVSKPIVKGQPFTANCVRVVRPGYGLRPSFWNEVLEATAARDLLPGQPLHLGDIEEKSLFLPRLKNLDFESERLLFRGIRLEDSADISRWRSDEAIIRWFKNPHKVTLSGQEQWFGRYTEDATRLDFMVEEKASGQNIGVVGLQSIDYGIGNGEIAYLIGEKQSQNKGYATEAVMRLEKLAKEILLLRRLVCTVHPQNLPSLRLAERLGYAQIEAGDFLTFEKSLGSKK